MIFFLHLNYDFNMEPIELANFDFYVSKNSLFLYVKLSDSFKKVYKLRLTKLSFIWFSLKCSFIFNKYTLRYNFTGHLGLLHKLESFNFTKIQLHDNISSSYRQLINKLKIKIK